MKIEEIENLSAYFDGEMVNSSSLNQALETDESAKKILNNFKVVSAHLKQDTENYLENIEPTLNNFWPELEKEINHQEEKLNELLHLSLGKLPDELAQADIWESINATIDEQGIVPQKTKASSESHKEFAQPSLPSMRNWESYLKESFRLPSKYEQLDVWQKIEARLNSELHEELFTENSAPDLDDKEKFYLGLSEYFDGEVSAAKAQIINDHLLTCASCRGYYLSFVKLKNTLKQAMQPQAIPSQESFWESLSDKLFPEENTQINLKKFGGL